MNRENRHVRPQLDPETLIEEGEAFARLTRDANAAPERVDVVVIGSGQAGLSVGYHLAKRGVRFVILDAGARIGDPWRKRWDSLRLFTPARYDALDGLPFPAAPDYFPTKDEMADYLESYAKHFQLPVRTGVRVQRVGKRNGRFTISTDAGEFEADQVVVAMANYQRRRVPALSRELSDGIVQIHSIDYKSPEQLQPGDTLIVGAGNSGAEIATELARSHKVWMSGRDTGHVPFRIGGFWGRLFLVRLVLRVVFHRILTIKTPMGRKVRPKVLHSGGPLIRTRPGELQNAGVVRTPRVVGVEDGLPLLEDGRVLQVKNVVWCTGYEPGFDWIDLPIFDEHGDPQHQGGVVPEQPGLYFVGLHFLFSFSSTMIHGVGRDAARIARLIAEAAAELEPSGVEPRHLLSAAE